MAATISGVFPVCLEQEQSSKEEGEMKKKQVALMEKLRSKCSPPPRSWTDSLMKSFRTTVVERKAQPESSERTHVQKCLYTLQRAMKVISQQSLLERLEGVAQHQGLTFGVHGSDPPSITLQADMFHIEITLNKGGGVKEVKIAHQGEASMSPELTDILSHGDFPEFTSHLEGLQSIYGVTGEKKLKSKVFLALQSLEKDLNDLAQFQSSISGVANYIHKSPLGILLPRTAGKPMKLIYFVSPYDLLDKKTMSAYPMTVEAITEHGLGRSVTVCLESGPTNKLQTMPLLSVTKNLPSFNGLTHANSANLPACFVLVLPQPIPVAMSIVHGIHSLTKLDTGKENGSQSLLSLILDSNSGGKIKNDQQLFVSLPDQHHRYFINGVSDGVLEKPGVMLSRIPFSHPTHVPKILIYLRRQLLFNSLLASCVRPAAKSDTSCHLVFELTIISLTQMTVTFEHPAHDTIVTVDIDLSDLTNLKCCLLCSNEEHRLCSDDTASRILQRCLSLPILLRALVQKGRSHLEKLMAEAKARAEEQAQQAREAAALWAAAQMRQQQQARLAPTMPTKGRPPPPQPPPPQSTPTYPPTPSPITSNPPSVGDRRGLGTGGDLLITSPPGYPAAMGSGGDSQQNNPLLVDLLDNERSNVTSPALAGQVQQSTGSMPITESPMLSKLLEDHISVATNITPVTSTSSALQQPQVKTKVSRGRKRRSQAELPTGRSPKHRVSDSDTSERFSSIDFESSSSPFESSLGGSGGMTGFHHPMGRTPPRPSSQGHMSSVIDLTEENMPESSLKKLVDFSIESMKPGGATPDSELHALLSQQEHNSGAAAGLKPNQMTGSKNENASTSPEGLLIGSGEVGKASLPDPAVVYPRVRSSSRSSTPPALTAFLGHGQMPPKARRDSDPSGYHQQPGGPFPPHQDYNPLAQPVMGVTGTGVGVSAGSVATAMARPKVVSSSSMTEVLDTKPSLPHGKKMGTLKTSVNTEYVMDKRGLFEKFDFTGQTVSSPHVTITSSTITPTTSILEGDDLMAPKVRLKLHPFRTPHGKSQSLDAGIVQSPSSAGSKSSNSNTFDFRSDEDDDEPISMNYTPSERLSVYSSSPTRLQISSKAKLPTPVSTPETPLTIKPEKYKRKDKSSGTTKRKRDKEESKKERKKKKFDHDLYLPTGKEPMYRASTVEGDQKSGTKLKIRVSKEHIKMPSPSKESGRIDMNSEKMGKFSEKVNDVFKKRSSTSSPTVEKLVLQKQDVRDQSTTGLEGGKDRDVTHLYRPAPSATGKSSVKTTNSKGIMASSNSSLSKTDPKLAKATIRLKPINISSSTSTSVSVTHSVKTMSSGRGMSDRSERRSQSASTSTAISTPTSSTMSLASILPNAPTASSVASLPPIPKRPKVSAITTTTSVTTSTAKSTSGMANNSNKNSPLNSSYNSSVNKLSGNSPGVGGRPGSNPNTPSSMKSPGMGFNKIGTPPGILKTSSNMPGHKASKTSGMPQGILKNSGNVSQGNTNSLKISPSGNQGHQKGSGGSNQLSNSAYNRGPNSSNISGGPQKQTLSAHGATKNIPSQGGNAFKGSGIQSNIGRGPGSGNQNFQKAPVSNPTGTHRSPSLVTQSDSGKMSGSPSQNSGLQKGVSQGKTVGTNPANAQHRNMSQGVNQSQGNSGVSSKPPNTTATTSVGQNVSQKLSGSQGRSMSTSSCNSSPSSTGRPAASARNNSVSGAGSGSNRAPPNHLPINRSVSALGQKAGAGSSPRNQSPSNPSAPKFPGQSPQQKSSGSSPSSSSQRSGSMVQTSGQRSSSTNSSQSGNNSKSSSTPTQRASSSPQMQRSANSSSGSSPTQRPASTPGLATDTRPASSGLGQTPGYPVRPSSAGPRQGSSPLGPKQTSSPGQRMTSSPSASRTSSPNGQRSGSGSGTGVSPLASRQSPTLGLSDPAPLSRQNSSGNLNHSLVSRHNSSGSVNSTLTSRQNPSGNVNRTPASRPSSTGSQNHPVVSRQNSSGNLTGTGISKQTTNSSAAANPTSSRQSASANSSPSAVLRQNSNSGVNASTVSQHSSSTKNTPTLSRQNSSNSLNSSMFRQNSSASSSVASSTKPTLSTSPKTVVASSASSRSVSTVVSVATSRHAATQGGPTSTSGKQLSSGSTSLSTATSASRTSSAVTSSTQRTFSGSSVVSSSTGVGSRTVNKSAVNGASGTKVSVCGGNGDGISGAVNKGASAGKPSATTLMDESTAVASVGHLPNMSGASVATVSVSRCGTSTISSVSSTNSAVSIGVKTQSMTSSTPSTKPSSSSLASVTASLSSASSSTTSAAVPTVSSKPSSLGAARGRKGSLSAIVDKLSRSASSGPSLDNGECSGSAGSGSAIASIPELPMEQRKSAMEESESGGEQRMGGIKRSSSVSGMSPPSSEQKMQRADSQKSSAPSTFSHTAPLPAHTTPPHTSSSVPTSLERRRSGSVGEKNATFLPKDSEDMGLDLSLPKDKTHWPEPLPPPQPDSWGQVSPKDSNSARSVSPAVGSEKGGTKFNGDSSKDRSRSESEMFKVPTPKTQAGEEVEEGSAGKSVSVPNSRSFPSSGSPLSDTSSPDNSLIIDCEESASHASSQLASSAISGVGTGTTNTVHSSIKRVAEIINERSNPAGLDRSSPVLSSGKASPSTSTRGVKNSPQASPHPKLSTSHPSPEPAVQETRVGSPCDIDDDLMDAALMGFNAS